MVATAQYAYLGQPNQRRLSALKGWPIPAILDVEGTLTGNVNIGSVNAPPQAGMCVHIQSLTAQTSAHQGPNFCGFEMGANLNMMPLFLWQSANDFDVANPGVPAGVVTGGTTTNIPGWIPVEPVGTMTALVAKGPFEIEITTYDTAQTYSPNDFLRAVTSNTDTYAGQLTNQNASGGQTFSSPGKCVWAPTTTSDSIVGRVSRGTYLNATGLTTLAFWPESLPGNR